ncbi:unnamed protein product [Lactuca saligna]|uniref:Uncharacterized protein n=1 Tax=Lactuca saligna TaxID=75948 RepID=A0AA35ZWX7_LACSI|nr:unnamed protein product [Lactuca saligna]
MSTFHTSFDTNTVNVNVLIASLGSTLRNKKDALENVHTRIQFANTEFQTFISSKIDKLYEDLAVENKIMDKISVKIENVKVLLVKLAHANRRIDDLLSKKDAMKSCIADVHAYLNNFNETRDTLITKSVRKHLVDKLRPVFAMLNRMEGVSESGTLPK